MNSMREISKISTFIMTAASNLSTVKIDNLIFAKMIKRPLERSVVGINAIIFR